MSNPVVSIKSTKYNKMWTVQNSDYYPVQLGKNQSNEWTTFNVIPQSSEPNSVAFQSHVEVYYNGVGSHPYVSDRPDNQHLLQLEAYNSHQPVTKPSTDEIIRIVNMGDGNVAFYVIGHQTYITVESDGKTLKGNASDITDDALFTFVNRNG